jgi:hypothetical protein
MTITTPEPRATAAARPGARTFLLAAALFGLATALAFAPAPPGVERQPQAAWSVGGLAPFAR